MDRFEHLTAKCLDEALSPTEGLDLANHLRAAEARGVTAVVDGLLFT